MLETRTIDLAVARLKGTGAVSLRASFAGSAGAVSAGVLPGGVAGYLPQVRVVSVVGARPTCHADLVLALATLLIDELKLKSGHCGSTARIRFVLELIEVNDTCSCRGFKAAQHTKCATVAVELNQKYSLRRRKRRLYPIPRVDRRSDGH